MQAITFVTSSTACSQLQCNTSAWLYVCEINHELDVKLCIYVHKHETGSGYEVL